MIRPCLRAKPLSQLIASVLLMSLGHLTQAATIDLRVLETTDLHTNMMDFDYYKDQTHGFVLDWCAREFDPYSAR